MINFYYKAVVRFIIFVTFLKTALNAAKCHVNASCSMESYIGSWGTFLAHALLALALRDTAAGSGDTSFSAL